MRSAGCGAPRTWATAARIPSWFSGLRDSVHSLLGSGELDQHLPAGDRVAGGDQHRRDRAGTGAVISVSIFIASSTTTTSPSAISCPSSTITRATVPDSGAWMPLVEAPTVCTWVGVKLPPVMKIDPSVGFGSSSTSTSTSYSTPLTVTLSCMVCYLTEWVSWRACTTARPCWAYAAPVR